MAVRKDLLYPGRWNPSDADFPLGGPKNRTAPGSQDGSYFDNAWIKDYEAFFGRLMTESGVNANEASDTAANSQFFEALIKGSVANPRNSDWSGFLDPSHTVPLGFEDTSSGSRQFGADVQVSRNIYSAGALNNFVFTDNGWTASEGIYKKYTYTQEQLSLIDISKVNIYIKGQDGSEHFLTHDGVDIVITKPDLTTLKVLINDSIRSSLGITHIWRFFITDKKGCVPELSVNGMIYELQSSILDDRTEQNFVGVKSSGLTYFADNSVDMDIYVRVTGVSAGVEILTEGRTFSANNNGNGTWAAVGISIKRGQSYVVTTTGIITEWNERRLP